jgi:hypothetical protein
MTLGVVAHIYNLIYSRGNNQKDSGSRPSWTKNKLARPHLNKQVVNAYDPSYTGGLI